MVSNISASLDPGFPSWILSHSCKTKSRMESMGSRQYLSMACFQVWCLISINLYRLKPTAAHPIMLRGSVLIFFLSQSLIPRFLPPPVEVWVQATTMQLVGAYSMASVHEISFPTYSNHQ